jgi:hypothetical protein
MTTAEDPGPEGKTDPATAEGLHCSVGKKGRQGLSKTISGVNFFLDTHGQF